jgi:hypothetical protein
MHYTVVKVANGKWRLFGQTSERSAPVMLNDYQTRAGAWCSAQLLLGRNKGSIQTVDRFKMAALIARHIKGHVPKGEHHACL